MNYMSGHNVRDNTVIYRMDMDSISGICFGSYQSSDAGSMSVGSTKTSDRNSCSDFTMVIIVLQRRCAFFLSCG